MPVSEKQKAQRKAEEKALFLATDNWPANIIAVKKWFWLGERDLETGFGIIYKNDPLTIRHHNTGKPMVSYKTIDDLVEIWCGD